jgi:hypothetical protein
MTIYKNIEGNAHLIASSLDLAPWLPSTKGMYNHSITPTVGPSKKLKINVGSSLQSLQMDEDSYRLVSVRTAPKVLAEMRGREGKLCT